MLAPFVAGQLLRRRIGGLVTRNEHALGPVDRASILLVVYVAFSAGMNQGVWSRATPLRLLGLPAVLAVLLAPALASTRTAARFTGLDRPSRIAMVMCGSQKSLANGLPMAAVLFGGRAAPAVLPLTLCHQMQLMARAGLAGRWSRSAPLERTTAVGPSASPVAVDG